VMEYGSGYQNGGGRGGFGGAVRGTCYNCKFLTFGYDSQHIILHNILINS
jgi:hypothetical protein